MKPGDTIEVGNKMYKVTNAPEDAELCAGCAARCDDELCERMPNCVGLPSCGDEEDFEYIYVPA